MAVICPLCGTQSGKKHFSRKRTLHECPKCHLIVAERSELLTRDEQKARYLTHENGIEHEGYREFLGRVIDASRPYLKPGTRGLDYGCGPAPTLSILVEREGLVMSNYDPIFFNTSLVGPFDIIFSTECFEHFEEPAVDIEKITTLLAADGILAIMTELWDEMTDFITWYYPTDPTHVSFYARKTMSYIAERFGLQPLAGDGRRVFVFRKISNER
jgi:hypothetical protein